MKSIIGYILYTISTLSAIALHFYTVYWVYEIHGIVWSFASFCTPIFSELIMAGASVSMYGWFNFYLLAWAFTGIIFKLGEFIISTASSESNAS